MHQAAGPMITSLKHVHGAPRLSPHVGVIDVGAGFGRCWCRLRSMDLLCQPDACARNQQDHFGPISVTAINTMILVKYGRSQISFVHNMTIRLSGNYAAVHDAGHCAATIFWTHEVQYPPDFARNVIFLATPHSTFKAKTVNPHPRL